MKKNTEVSVVTEVTPTVTVVAPVAKKHSQNPQNIRMSILKKYMRAREVL